MKPVAPPTLPRQRSLNYGVAPASPLWCSNAAGGHPSRAYVDWVGQRSVGVYPHWCHNHRDNGISSVYEVSVQKDQASHVRWYHPQFIILGV